MACTSWYLRTDKNRFVRIARVHLSSLVIALKLTDASLDEIENLPPCATIECSKYNCRILHIPIAHLWVLYMMDTPLMFEIACRNKWYHVNVCNIVGDMIDYMHHYFFHRCFFCTVWKYGPKESSCTVLNGASNNTTRTGPSHTLWWRKGIEILTGARSSLAWCWGCVGCVEVVGKSWRWERTCTQERRAVLRWHKTRNSIIK